VERQRGKKERGGSEERSERTSVLQGVLTVLSLLAGAAALGPLAVVVGVASFAALLASVLGGGGGLGLPPFQPSLAWLKSAAGALAPLLPFTVPFAVFVAVTWPLASKSESLQFQEQASQIIPVLLVGFVLETSAMRWGSRRVNWILSLMTVVILLLGETIALISLWTRDHAHADVVAGSMAAGVAAILIAAVLGMSNRGEWGEPA
jgi:hypothetical protein